MTELKVEQIRAFRLHSHHLDAFYEKEDVNRVVGACGMQNTPPGAWETALYNRIPDCGLAEMERLLYEDKFLLQAWSLRGTPMVFPVSQSDVFLSALCSEEEESWIYTRGIGLALDFLQMTFDEVLDVLRQVIPRLDGHVIVSKTALDQTLAEWMIPLLPMSKRELWNDPSMYGNPEKQTVGGAVVSFLLRPCAFEGMVVFGERQGGSPSFTSYKNWIGLEPVTGEDAVKKLARMYLHGYGPSTVDGLVNWLGCSGKQGRRIWDSISQEMEAVTVCGKKAYILTADRERLFTNASFPRELLLLGGHDPYLDQRDRSILQPDQSLQKQIWKMVTNPGAIVYRGEVIGIWTAKKKNVGLEIRMTVWQEFSEKNKLCELAEGYAAFRQLKLLDMNL